MLRAVRKVALVAVGLVSVVPALAGAQNADPYFFGDDAALAGGAVTASGRDAGSLWYNPAGLGGLEHGSISASASTFGVRIRSVPDALRVRVGGQLRQSDLASTDILSVPNAVLLGASLTPRVGLAFGLLTTQRDVRAALVANPEGAAQYQGVPVLVRDRLDLQTDASEYHAGGAVGIALTNTLRVGLSAFVTYAKVTNTVQYALALRSGDVEPETAFIVIDSRVTRSVVGAAGGVGVQWQPSRRVALGLAIRAPEIGLTSSANGGASQAFGNAGGGTPGTAEYTTVDAAPDKASGRVLVPGRALLGVAFAAGGGSWIEAGVDATHGLPDTSAAPARRPTVNGRIGARLALSPSWVLGGGIFTDRAVTRDLASDIGSYRVDYYGLTLGVSKRTPLALLEKPSPDALVLVTTFSLRAAAGIGQSRAATIDLDDSGARDERSNVTFWDVMPYLGSSVLF